PVAWTKQFERVTEALGEETEAMQRLEGRFCPQGAAGLEEPARQLRQLRAGVFRHTLVPLPMDLDGLIRRLGFSFSGRARAAICMSSHDASIEPALSIVSVSPPRALHAARRRRPIPPGRPRRRSTRWRYPDCASRRPDPLPFLIVSEFSWRDAAEKTGGTR